MPAATALPRHVPVAVAYRGGHPENIHHGSVAVVNTRGELLASVGDVETPLFTRSALKPFQAMPLVARNAETLRMEDADIALLCASHSGEPMHVERAASLLARIGADETTLACGTHVPFFFGANGLTPPPEARFNRLHHNCSGKHTGMLLLADALGAPLSGYLDRAHPVQQEIARSVSHFMDVPMHRLVLGTDGCSAPNYAVPLRALAQGFARLTLVTPDAVYGEAPLRVARVQRQPLQLQRRPARGLSAQRRRRPTRDVEIGQSERGQRGSAVARVRRGQIGQVEAQSELRRQTRDARR